MAVVLASVVLVGCTAGISSVAVVSAPSTHKAYPAGTACDASGCHDTFKHEPLYAGACETCHDTVTWINVKYSHKAKAFDMGMHPLIGCSTCHIPGQPLPTGGCAASACHARKAPHGGWLDCGKCHTTIAWTLRQPIPEKHLSLAGGHAKLDCLKCHNLPVAPAKPRGCVDCHGVKHGGLRNCESCHDPARMWKPKPGFNHSQFFTLVGAHRKLKCAQCHLNGRFAGTPRYCSGCHGSKHGGLTQCQRCHTTSAFRPSTFSHSSVWRRTGAHAKLACSRCHPGNRYAQVRGTQCVNCHGTKHGGLKSCGSCHNTTAFRPAAFRHSRVFPLLGKHATLACTKCHAGGAFAKVKGTRCVDCHGVKHGGQTQCQNCHTTTAFAPSRPITHPAPVVLGTAHAWPNPCQRCHPTLNFTAPTTPCETCHAGVVPHTGPTHCTNCHRPTTWSDVHYTHPPTGSPHAPGQFGAYPAGCTCHGLTATKNFTTVACPCH